MKTIIRENQRGLLFKNGKFVKMLESGKYHTFGDSYIEVLELSLPLVSGEDMFFDGCTLDTLLADKKLAEQVVTVEVADQQLALHYINGRFEGALQQGRHTFWNVHDRHTFKIIDISSPKISDEVPRYIFDSIPGSLYKKVEVAEYQKARLCFDCKLVKLLDAGTYYFWRTNVKVDAALIDTRLLQMDIAGQEILSKDKVALRVNFVCNYRIADYVKVLTEIDDFKEQLHVAAQLALRDYVGKYRIDEILENKEEMSKYVFERLKAKEKELFVEVADAGVKDIILPGEIRDIMNTVLAAEKRAQANVITRREEVASTRSLLNTAKLMDENKTLYKLKELEYVERICENVGSINVSGNADLLSQLTGILRGGNGAA